MSSSDFVLGNGPAPHHERLPSIDTLTSPQLDQSPPQFNYSSAQFSKVTYDDRARRQGSISSMDSVVTTGSSGGPHSPGAGTKRSYSSSEVDEPGWDDRCIDNYYQVVHPALPILPSSKVRLRARLLACSNPTLRYTLLCAVCGLVKKNEGGGDYYRQQVLQGVVHADTRTMASQSRILYLMSLALLFLQTGDAMWLGAAINFAYEMGLHSHTHSSSSGSGSGDDDGAVGRRLFLVLVMLDRLNATLKRVPVQIPEDAVRLDGPNTEAGAGAGGDDAAAFGGAKIGVHAVRLCMILGHAGAGEVAGELAGAHAAIEPLWDTMPVLKALYYLVLVRRDRRRVLEDGEGVSGLLNNTGALGVLLESPLISVSPLVGYFVPPLVTTLLDVAGVVGPDERARLWSQLDTLDGLIERKFPEFGPLRHDISQARLADSSGASPKSKLEGLAAIAHAAHQQQNM
ncbi:hypothetical protein TRICI_002016 [Trichomonascus ciferrii]|uniref:Transcription factor domain-containing protein n=1 Tax=Trichomonascus ciferrii TaxID=44093 RepID=A0A642V7V1_9ASCO|nr:hypothetical protein TRICI_002016 [Trichomonascus ciferrii]